LYVLAVQVVPISAWLATARECQKQFLHFTDPSYNTFVAVKNASLAAGAVRYSGHAWITTPKIKTPKLNIRLPNLGCN